MWRAGLIGVVAVVTAGLVPGDAEAKLSCRYVKAEPAGPGGNILRIHAHGNRRRPGLNASFPFIHRGGKRIFVDELFGIYGVRCRGGRPTVKNVDQIVLSSGRGTSVTGDMSIRVLSPGAAVEPDGTSEIELTLRLRRSSNYVDIYSGDQPDHFELGTDATGAFGANLNADEPIPDLDVEIVKGSLYLEGQGGNDVMSVGGSGLAPAARASTFFAGPGHDVLIGGPGADSLFGESGSDVLTGGDGPDFLDDTEGEGDLDAGPGDDVVFTGGGKRADVDCGLGTDIAGGEKGEVLANCEHVIRTRSFFRFLRFLIRFTPQAGSVSKPFSRVLAFR